jgi:predicted AAA+ superfamily ATPase
MMIWGEIDEPEWMESVRPNAQYENCSSDFQYDDGGPYFDWTNRSYDYPQNHLSFIENIHAKYEESSHVLDIPNIDVESLNQEQLMAYNIVFKTLHLFISNNEDFEALRMVITGTAGSGKSYLIKCIIKAVRTIFQTNRSVQVLYPTGNSANLISGMTMHSFLKILINARTKEMTT